MSEQVPVEAQNPLFLLYPQQSQQQKNPISEHPPQSSNSVSECIMHKNRLQEYAQKSSLQLPIYESVNEGARHASQFRATVVVDGTKYTSQRTFSNRKSAEQDAARIALQDIQQKIKNDGCPIIQEDTTFCKSILNEYAVKMHLEKPSYSTIQLAGLIPVFVSTLVFNGVGCTGDKGRSKKEAEQLAARVIILSILDSADSVYATVMSLIIKSKSKLYAALNKSRDTNSVSSPTVPIVNTSKDTSVQLNKRKEAEVTGTTISLPITAISQFNLAEFAKIQAAHLPLQQFKKPKPDTSSMEITPPFDFLPPGLGQPLLSSTSVVKESEIGSQMPDAVVPLNNIPPCSVAQ
ncbi:hypothetical protein ACH5RR_011627 [Cinchona calisaya]|uniref:DRBM domain-containing protein n=1 Tax=Cinchona calisaya TaxID=153742 RepID=A0ABD3A5F7_9GENT